MSSHGGKIYQVSELATNRVAFVDEARHGLARLRDKDGTSLVMVPEADYELLQELSSITGLHLLLNKMSSPGVATLPIAALGEFGWLRTLDADDLKEFSEELGESLAAARGDGAADIAREVVNAWKITARQLADPLRQSVLRGPLDVDDLVEAGPPRSEAEAG